jgi:hypothetical protein
MTEFSSAKQFDMELKVTALAHSVMRALARQPIYWERNKFNERVLDQKALNELNELRAQFRKLLSTLELIKNTRALEGQPLLKEYFGQALEAVNHMSCRAATLGVMVCVLSNLQDFSVESSQPAANKCGELVKSDTIIPSDGPPS